MTRDDSHDHFHRYPFLYCRQFWRWEESTVETRTFIESSFKCSWQTIISKDRISLWNTRNKTHMLSSWIFASVFGSIDKAATTNEFSTIELRSATTKFSGEVTIIISIILHTQYIQHYRPSHSFSIVIYCSSLMNNLSLNCVIQDPKGKIIADWNVLQYLKPLLRGVWNKIPYGDISY